MDQHVHRIVIVGNGLRHVAVIGGVMHGRHHEAVHEQGARVLVYLIFDWISVHGDFDDDVEFVRDIVTGRYFADAHLNRIPMRLSVGVPTITADHGGGAPKTLLV